MYACVCFSVTEEEVTEEVARGAHTEEALGDRCGAGTNCGTCVERLGCLIEAALRDRPTAEAMESCPVPCSPAQRLHDAGDAARSRRVPAATHSA
jgi:bacterioferritin-associated ferredoxin